MVTVLRLRDEEKVCKLIRKLQSYLEKTGSRSEICRIYLRHIDHRYYKVSVSENSVLAVIEGKKKNSGKYIGKLIIGSSLMNVMYVQEIPLFY